MTEETTVPAPDEAGDEDPRKQLWIRAGVAGGLIAVLLGGLAIFDHLSRPPQPEEIVAPTRPIAPAQVRPEPGRDAPPEVVRAGGPVTDAPAEVPPLPAAEGSAPPALPAGDRLERAARSERASKAIEVTRPQPKPAAAPAAATLAPAPEAAARPAPRVEAPPPAAPAVTRPAAVPPPPPAAVVAAPAAARAGAPSGDAQANFALQVGGFMTPAEAEALRARLSAEGIPSQLEVRVIAGPFADRRDALAAQARLRDKGFSAAELIPFRR